MLGAADSPDACVVVLFSATATPCLAEIIREPSIRVYAPLPGTKKHPLNDLTSLIANYFREARILTIIECVSASEIPRKPLEHCK